MEPQIENLKVKETDHCIKCDGTLKTKSLGGYIFSISGSGAFYCENKDCDLFGVLTLARTRKTEKKEEPNPS